MADDLDLDGLEREALKATQDPVSTAFLTKTNADVDEWMTSVYTAGKDADFRLHCLWAWQEQARRSASTILDLIHRLRAAETAVSQGQADLLAVSAALAEARDNDRAAMGWLVDARAAAGDDGKRMLPEFVEYLKELRADAERLAKLEQWMPIETAPPDEVVLLACEFDGPGDWRIKCGYFDNFRGSWKVWGASWAPTRWAAIPAPPA